MEGGYLHDTEKTFLEVIHRTCSNPTREYSRFTAKAQRHTPPQIV
jgi:hypothetical protein